MKMVLVEWDDSCSHANEWMDREEEKGLAHCISIGFMVYKERDKVALAQSFHPSEDNVHNEFVIPRGCIKRIKELDIK